jgi:hypothetical protein
VPSAFVQRLQRSIACQRQQKPRTKVSDPPSAFWTRVIAEPAGKTKTAHRGAVGRRLRTPSLLSGSKHALPSAPRASFDTGRRRFHGRMVIGVGISCSVPSLKPAWPVLPIGVSRRFRAAAYIRPGASPNELFSCPLGLYPSGKYPRGRSLIGAKHSATSRQQPKILRVSA